MTIERYDRFNLEMFMISGLSSAVPMRFGLPPQSKDPEPSKELSFEITSLPNGSVVIHRSGHEDSEKNDTTIIEPDGENGTEPTVAKKIIDFFTQRDD